MHIHYTSLSYCYIYDTYPFAGFNPGGSKYENEKKIENDRPKERMETGIEQDYFHYLG